MRLHPGPDGDSSPDAAVRAVVFGGVAAALSALAWTRTLQGAFLAFAAALAGASLLWPLLRRRAPAAGPASPALLALLLLFGAVGSGGFAEWRLRRLATDWEQMVLERRTELSRRLDRRMAELIERASRAAEAAYGAARAGPAAEGSALVPELQRLRTGSGVAALVVIDPAGELVAWSGDHRGSLPVEVRNGPDSVVFAERPLFSYLYLTRSGPERGARAMAAVLLETDLALAGERVPSFADGFQRSTGARPRFVSGAPPEPDAGGPAAWTLESGGRPVVSARLAVPSQAEWRRRIVSDGRQAVAFLVAGALVLLFAAWRRVGPRKERDPWGVPRAGQLAPAALPLGIFAAALLLLPLGELVGASNLFSPADFLLPLPFDVTLGMLLAVVVPVAALVAAAGEPAWVRRFPWAAAFVGAVAVGVGYPLLIGVLLRAASLSLLEGGSGLWWGLQVTGAVLLSIVTAWLLPSGGLLAGAPSAESRELQPDDLELSRLPGRGAPLAAALVVSAGLGVLAMVRLDPRAGAVPVAAALWVVPFLIAASALPPARARGSRVLRWLVAGWLAASALLPQLWLANIASRLQAAEVELTSLGTQSDPLLHYLLQRFAAEAERRGAEGESGVELLYRSWVASGLADGGYPGWISLWDGDDEPRVTLELGATPEERRAAGEGAALEPLLLRARAAGSPLIEVAPTRHVNLAMAVPLPDGRILTVAVPPRRTLEGGTSLLRASAEGDLRLLRLTLVPATTPGSLRRDSVHWVRSEEGWRSEAVVPYPDGNYHAHLQLHVAPLGVRIARAVLLLALDLGVLALLWLLGRVAGGEPPTPLRGWRAWGGSFRARITAALLAFFLAPTFLFGAVAYRSLSGEVVRSARLVAERSAAQAVTAFEAAQGDLTALSAFTGTDVLFYHRGELAGSSAPEAVDLGLYGAWMPARVFLTLESGEELTVVEERQVVGRPYVVAYHRLPATGTLAVPVSLSAGDAAIRQRELAHLVLFAALFGGVLSLTLSVAVARALAHPIGRLRRAAATVGAGRLDARLPEDRRDEFGELFASFNRMTLQLRRARARELRTARVLAWGEMARQVAHEIKNPLTPIKLSVQHVRRAYADRRADFEAILESNVQQILAEIDRLSEIARAFSRYGAPAEAAGPLEEVDVAKAVREVLALYRSGETALEYAADLDGSLPSARARVGELKEVLVNLLENARAAMDGPGRIIVSAAPEEGGRIVLEVRDEGEGIPAELLPRVFDPQFSTRSSGTGLGLAIVRRLVEGWGGRVGVTSEPGEGTVVRVWLPVAAEEERESRSSREHGRGT